MSNILVPAAGYAVIEKTAQQQTTTSGLYVPPTAKDEPIGTVVAIAASFNDKPATAQVGDTVVFKDSEATKVTIDGTQYYVIDEYEIISTVKTVVEDVVS